LKKYGKPSINILHIEITAIFCDFQRVISDLIIKVTRRLREKKNFKIKPQKTINPTIKNAGLYF